MTVAFTVGKVQAKSYMEKQPAAVRELAEAAAKDAPACHCRDGNDVLPDALYSAPVAAAKSHRMILPKQIPPSARVIASTALLLMALLAFKWCVPVAYVYPPVWVTANHGTVTCVADNKSWPARGNICYSVDAR